MARIKSNAKKFGKVKTSANTFIANRSAARDQAILASARTRASKASAGVFIAPSQMKQAPRDLQVFAVVGRKKITPATKNISGQDIASSQYANAMKQQCEAVVATWREIIKELRGITPDILLAALEPTFEKSQKYCPVDTGALKESGYLEAEQLGTTARVTIGYAKGGEPNYAVLVHELLMKQHKSPTRAKFLLSALEEDSGIIEKRILKGYKQVMGM